jgi:hypothetical protein
MYTIENNEFFEKKTFQEGLERQYGPAVAQDIMDHLAMPARAARAPDYMDVKAMSELQERLRAQAMVAVWRLKQWRKGEDKNNLPNTIIRLEGVFLQRQCEDSVALYRLATKTYFAMFRAAMAAFGAHRLAPVSVKEVAA